MATMREFLVRCLLLAGVTVAYGLTMAAAAADMRESGCGLGRDRV